MRTRPVWPASAAQAAGRPRLGGASGSLRCDLALAEASGAPAGRGLSQLGFVTLGAEGDLGKEEQAASLAEPAYTPPGGPVTVGGVLEDLLEEALRETDAAVLCRLKAVSVA